MYTGSITYIYLIKKTHVKGVPMQMQHPLNVPSHFPPETTQDPSFRNLWDRGGLHNCAIGSVVAEVLELAGLRMFQITIRPNARSQFWWC